MAAVDLPLYKGPLEEIEDRKLVIEAGAADPLFFGHYFFPRAYRQEDPPFARRVWWELLNPEHRFVNVKMARGFTKTTTLRTFTTHRVSYGMSRVILYIGKNDDAAKRSVEWIRKAIKFNTRWQKVFGVARGERFNQNVLEVDHGIEGHTIYITAAGILGSLRGINFDDYRPDLIILDDIIDKEMVNTPAAAKKVSDLVFSDVMYSLESETDNPNSKLVNLATPMNENDPASLMAKDPEFHTIDVPCWTEATMGLDIDQQESAWPARFPTETLRRRKRNAGRTNRLYLFLQEMELRLTSPDTQSFKDEWYQTWEVLPPREELTVVMTVDPVPPPSPKQIAEGMAKKDYESLSVVGAHKTGFYELETLANRGHEPDWTIWAFFTLVQKWRPRIVRVEGVAYQRTLEWILRRAMQERRHWQSIETFTDRRSKHDVIVDALNGPSSNGRMYFHPQNDMAREQFLRHPDITHDDVIESIARGVEWLHLQGLNDEEEEDGFFEEEKRVAPLQNWRLIT
jgi:hypothetical protein